jgi:hypothetical protein
MLGWDRNPLRRRIDWGVEAAWRLMPATGPPLRHSQVQAHTALAEWAAVLVLGLLLSLAGGAGESCSPSAASPAGPGHAA